MLRFGTLPFSSAASSVTLYVPAKFPCCNRSRCARCANMPGTPLCRQSRQKFLWPVFGARPCGVYCRLQKLHTAKASCLDATRQSCSARYDKRLEPEKTSLGRALLPVSSHTNQGLTLPSSNNTFRNSAHILRSRSAPLLTKCAIATQDCSAPMDVVLREWGFRSSVGTNEAGQAPMRSQSDGSGLRSVWKQAAIRSRDRIEAEKYLQVSQLSMTISLPDSLSRSLILQKIWRAPKLEANFRICGAGAVSNRRKRS